MGDGTITRLQEKMLLAYDEHCKSISLRSGQGLDSNESPADRRKTRKAKEKEYIDWFEWMFPEYAKVKSAWFHKKLAKILIENDKYRHMLPQNHASSLYKLYWLNKIEFLPAFILFL